MFQVTDTGEDITSIYAALSMAPKGCGGDDADIFIADIEFVPDVSESGLVNALTCISKILIGLKC